MSRTISFPTEEKITEWLKENGYDGFYNEDCDCGCYIGDIAPCGETFNITSGSCKAARLVPNSVFPEVITQIKKVDDNE